MTIPNGGNAWSQDAHFAHPMPIQGCTDCAVTAAASGTSIGLTVPGITNGSIVCSQVFWSYSTAGAGRITIEDGSGNIVFDQDLSTPASNGNIDMSNVPIISQQVNTPMIFRLYAVAGATAKMVPRAWYRL